MKLIIKLWGVIILLFGFFILGILINIDSIYAWEKIIGVNIDYHIISTIGIPVIFLLVGVGFYLLVKGEI